MKDMRKLFKKLRTTILVYNVGSVINKKKPNKSVIAIKIVQWKYDSTIT